MKARKNPFYSQKTGILMVMFKYTVYLGGGDKYIFAYAVSIIRCMFLYQGKSKLFTQ